VADLLDVLTLAEGTAALADGAPDAGEVASYITAVSRWMDRLIGPVVNRTVTSETHHGGREYVDLQLWPVVQVTTVVEDGVTLAGSGLIADGWIMNGLRQDMTLGDGTLWRRSEDTYSTWEHGFNKVVVTYVAGRGFAATADVDEFYKDGARLLLQNAWASEQFGTRGFGEFAMPSNSFRKFSVPNAFRDQLAGQMRYQAQGIAVG
jgi:hypothetical protein